MKSGRLSAVGRPVDPSYPTNRAIVAIALVVIVAGTIYRLGLGSELLPAGLWGLGAGLTAFLTWALGRELDPDHDLSAFVGAGLALIAVWVWDLPGLLPLFLLLLMLRMVNRTTGLAPTVLDSLGALALAGALLWEGQWVYGLAAATAFASDAALEPGHRRQWLFAALAALLTLAGGFWRGGFTSEAGFAWAPALIGLALALAGLPLIQVSRRPRSTADATGEALRPARVQAAARLGLVTGFAVALVGGWAGLIGLSPLWAASLGASLYWLWGQVAA